MGKKKVIFAAGGTGGHLLPAQEIAKKLQEENIDVMFVGAGLAENMYFDRKQFKFAEISARTPFQKELATVLKSMYVLFKGIVQSYKLLRTFNPDLVIGFGSFHVFPVLYAAKLHKRPLMLFESNAIAGKVTRFFSPSAIHTAIHLPLIKPIRGNLVEVDWPLKLKDPALSQQIARAQLQLDPNRFTILIFGGSQGSSAINRTLVPICKKLLAANISFQVIHLAGKSTISELQEFCKMYNIPAFIRSFEKDMGRVLRAADLAICRAGAATIAELIEYNLPAVLIPYPHAVEQHQKENALFLKRLSAACMVEEGINMEQIVIEFIEKFYKESAIREQMRLALGNLNTKKREISELIIKALNE